MIFEAINEKRSPSKQMTFEESKVMKYNVFGVCFMLIIV